MRKAGPARPFELQISASVGRRYVPALEDALRRAHAILRPPALREMSVALVSDRRMSELHKRFMGIAGPTDVLTFPLEFDRRGRATAGEVVVCVPEAARQARERATGLDRELLLYALHGMLHLAGFDDRTDPAYQKMHRTEDEILTELGIGPVFAAPPARARRHTTTVMRRRRAASAPANGRARRTSGAS